MERISHVLFLIFLIINFTYCSKVDKSTSNDKSRRVIATEVQNDDNKRSKADILTKLLLESLQNKMMKRGSAPPTLRPPGLWGRRELHDGKPPGLWGREVQKPIGLWGREMDQKPVGLWGRETSELVGREEEEKEKLTGQKPIGLWGRALGNFKRNPQATTTTKPAGLDGLWGRAAPEGSWGKTAPDTLWRRRIQNKLSATGNFNKRKSFAR